MDRPNKMLSDLNKKEKKPRKKTEKELFEKGTKQKKIENLKLIKKKLIKDLSNLYKKVTQNKN